MTGKPSPCLLETSCHDWTHPSYIRRFDRDNPILVHSTDQRQFPTKVYSTFACCATIVEEIVTEDRIAEQEDQ